MVNNVLKLLYSICAIEFGRLSTPQRVRFGRFYCISRSIEPPSFLPCFPPSIPFPPPSPSLSPFCPPRSFFQVGIEEMVKRVSMLDPYSRPLLAPLGIVFPFPMFCSKLDSYMKHESELSAYFSSSKGAVVFFALLQINQLFGFVPGNVLSNQQFWAEWPSIDSNISPNLKNLFNQIFVLLPSFRCTLRDIAGHPWRLSKSQLTPDDIMQHMKSRLHIQHIVL